MESTEHHFLHCHDHVNFATSFMNELNSVNNKFNTLEPDELIRIIVYRDKNLIMTPIPGY